MRAGEVGPYVLIMGRRPNSAQLGYEFMLLGLEILI